jgi:hypothetical protein
MRQKVSAKILCCGQSLVVGLDGFSCDQFIHTPPEPLFVAFDRIEPLEFQRRFSFILLTLPVRLHLLRFREEGGSRGRRR